MLRVWVDGRSVGVLDRFGPAGSSFAYDPLCDRADVVSLTMPVRVPSWNSLSSMLPAFDMNLPEGMLKDRLRREFAKAAGTFDDMDLLAVVGRSQIGRVRLSAMDGTPNADVPFQSVDELLRARREGDLLDFMMARYAALSGLSGVQPKAMFRGLQTDRKSRSVLGATHVVKFWQPDEYPELAANEYFCMEVARAAGVEVPTFHLSDNGEALVVERFDLRDGRYIGFEDFCSLNGAVATGKYAGGYETKLFRRASEFLPAVAVRSAMADLLRLFVVNCVLRNGDAHLKNFGVLYEGAEAGIRLSPAYDIVTTTAYLPKDRMALTLNGSPAWPDRKMLLALARTRADMSPKAFDRLVEQVADAVSAVAPRVPRYFASSSAPDIGLRMIEAWREGVRHSLGADEKRLFATLPSP